MRSEEISNNTFNESTLKYFFLIKPEGFIKHTIISGAKHTSDKDMTPKRNNLDR